jgi:IS5 family transposase
LTGGPNPTDRRGKRGTKRHLLTDKNGMPLSVVITAANTHDMKAAITTIDRIVVKRLSPKKILQNLCLDKGYDFLEIEHEEAVKRSYVLHIRHRGEEKRKH